jgi:hypothetical protein
MGNGAAWASALPHPEDESAVPSSSWLHDHMVREHGRTGPELDGLPLADLHHFEHVEQAMGLTDLGHHHPAEVGTHTHVSGDPDGASIPRLMGDADGYLPRSPAWAAPV